MSYLQRYKQDIKFMRKRLKARGVSVGYRSQIIRQTYSFRGRFSQANKVLPCMLSFTDSQRMTDNDLAEFLLEKISEKVI